LKYLINRLALDEIEVRAATVTCLGQIAIQRKDLQDDIQLLLENIKNDISEEVRGRC